MRLPLPLTCLIALVLALAGTGRLSAQPVQFTNITAGTGLDSWISTDTGLLMASSSSWLDANGDGLLDVLCVGGSDFGVPIALFINLGNGTWVDLAAASGIVPPQTGAYYMGSACADYDNDGDTDIYIDSWGANYLYRNDGNLSFTDVTATAGVNDPSWGSSCAWGDYDGDGFLDLFVGNYIAILNFPFHTPYPNVLYHNNGDGTFTDVTAITGVGGFGTTLATTFSDYDDDGDLDILVVNDFGDTIEPNQLWRNDGPAPGPPGAWNFSDQSLATGFDLQIFGMGVAVGDYDRDLDLDYYFSNLGKNQFLQNDGMNGFSNVTDATGTGMEWLPSDPTLFVSSWGNGFFDFDNDGWLDLYVSNGYIPAASYIANGALTPNALFHHDGPSLTFTEMGTAAGIDDILIGRGVAFADYDADGDVDILQSNINGGPMLFRNDSPPGGKFLRVNPIGRQSPRDATGTRMQAEFGGYALLAESNAHRAYLSTCEKTVHFGLGAETTVPKLKIDWPSGAHQELHHLPVNFTLPLIEPTITVDPSSSAPIAVAGGGTLSLNLVLKNETATLQTGVNFLQIRAFGIDLVITPIAPISVPASGTLSLPISFGIPVGLTGGATVPIEFVWWVGDDFGPGIVQWQTFVDVGP